MNGCTHCSSIPVSEALVGDCWELMRCDLIMKFDTMIPWSESMETTFIPKTSYQEKPSNSYALIYLVSPSSLRLSKSYFKKKTISCSCFNWYGLCKTFKVFSSCLLYCLILCIMFSWGDKFSGSFFHTSLYQLQLSIHEEWKQKIVEKWSPLVLTETLGCILIPCLTDILILFIIRFHQSSFDKKV